jgi:ATP-dependent Clp protease ATP-binding subunit ClpC
MLSFDDPRLAMSVAGRFLVRVVNWTAYLVFIAATFTFLISGVVRLRLFGVFLALMLIDFIIHRNEGDMPIAELPKGGMVNVASVLRPSAFLALERAFDISIVAKHDFFLEMTRRLLEFPEIDNALQRLDVPLKEFKQKLDEFAGEQNLSLNTFSRDQYLDQLKSFTIVAFGQAINAGHNFIEVGDLFSALQLSGDETMNRLFNLFSLEPGDVERALIFGSRVSSGLGRLPVILGGFMPETHRRINHRIMNRAWTSRPTPTLDRYSVDFTDLARNGQIGFLVGHAEEYERLAETLGRPMSPNALLIGEAGIGKEAIVQHLAFRLAKDDVPRGLFDKRLVSLELQNLIAGASIDEVNGRVQTIVEEIYLAGNIILYIPDIHNLMKASGTAYISVADAFIPIIKNDSFPVVGATYPKEFKQLIEPRSDFAPMFEVIHVNEITEADAQKILTYESILLEKQSGVTISFGAVKQCVSLAKKYFHQKFLPVSAEELLKSTVVEAEHRGEKKIGPDLVTAVAETKSNVPMHEASGVEAEKLLKLEDIIHERLVDQEQAVKAVATGLREYRTGLARKGGPIASFLFVGPTGVGKTELAKILADIQFGSEKMMTRFDMTEYQDRASYARFIGSADGQIRGALTDAILEKPYGLILLDEFEKAFPDILDLFLQVFDDGRLTDGLGRTVDFTNAIIIATSNAHSDIINDALAKGESMTDIAEYLKKRLIDIFKPELINRFSNIIIFKNLEPKELHQIVALNLQEFAATLKEQGIYLDFDPAAVAAITKLGYDPAFGARPLRRVIEEKIRAPLAEAILHKTVAKGSRIKLVYENETFGFSG